MYEYVNVVYVYVGFDSRVVGVNVEFCVEDDLL